MKPQALSPRPSSTPYRLQFSAGYAGLKLRNTDAFGGPAFQAAAGQGFSLGRRTAVFFQATVRYAALENHSRRRLSQFHLGLAGGFEFSLAPRWLSAFLFTGLGGSVFHSASFAVAPQGEASLHNATAFALTLGGGFSLLRDVLVLAAAWQPNFGLQVPAADSAPRGYNPQGYYFNAGLDAARLTAWLRRKEDAFETPASFVTWIRGFKPGLVLDATYTYNFRRPAGGENSLRGFDKRWDRPMGNYLELALERPAEAASPFGLRVDFGVGEDAAFAAPVDAYSGKYYTLQQLYAALRLPVGRGLTVRGPIFATPIGAEVLEGPLNNQVSRSLQFNYGIPFRHLGMLADYPASERVAVSAGLVHGWDNVFQLGNQVSPAFLGALNVLWGEKFKTNLAGTVGEDLGRLRGLIDLIATVRLKRFTLTGNYDWGHDGKGRGLPADNWQAFSLAARYDFNRYAGLSARGEVFADSNGVRTGTRQILGEVTSTLHVQPWKWLRLRLEYRHDQSNRSSFRSHHHPARKQDTLALGVGLVF